MDDNWFGTARNGDPSRMIQHPHCHAVLPVALGMAEESGERGVHGETDIALARQNAELLAVRHGASPEHFMAHLAMWEAPPDGGEEHTWGAHVTDAEYLG